MELQSPASEGSEKPAVVPDVAAHWRGGWTR